MSLACRFGWAVVAGLGWFGAGASLGDEVARGFDVVIAGGTTAAFAAAVAAAESGARTALIEPTDWVGGQLTASAVPAVDEAWHKAVDPTTGEVLDVAAIARRPENMTPHLRAMLLATGNPGGGWVSRFCFLPRDFLARHLIPLAEAQGPNLVIYRDTVVKAVDVDPATGHVRSLTAIRRTPRLGVEHGGYDRPLSADLLDWYDPAPSPRFAKAVLRFAATEIPGRSTVFLDATEWGEVLALSGFAYLQGVDRIDGGREGDDACGQAITVGIVERIDPAPTGEPPGPADVPGLGFGMYRDRPDAWERIWTYRRLRGHGSRPAVGDLSLQNWGYSARLGEGGNDYPFGYVFLPRDRTAAQRGDWRGGIDVAVPRRRRASGAGVARVVPGSCPAAGRAGAGGA